MENEQIVSDNTQDAVSDSTENQEQLSRGEQKFKNDLIKFKQLALDNQKKVEEYERKLHEREIEEEEKKGNLTKVLEEYKNKTRTLEENLKKKDFLFAKSNIDNALKTEALKMGCKDPDVFVRLIAKEKRDMVQFDEAYSPDPDDIKMVVQEAAKAYSHIGLFGKEVKIADAPPRSNVDNGPAKKPTEEDVYNNYFKSKGWR